MKRYRLSGSSGGDVCFKLWDKWQGGDWSLAETKIALVGWDWFS
jgi:hypothetical protein